MAQVAVQAGAGSLINSMNTGLRIRDAFQPAAVAATVNGLGMDLQGYDSLSIAVSVAAITDGGYTVSLEHSDDDGSSDAYAAGPVFDEALAEYTSTNDVRVDIRKVIDGTVPTKRWVRIVITETTAGATGGTFSAVGLLGNKRHQDGTNAV
jgi:hypothetical protein